MNIYKFYTNTSPLENFDFDVREKSNLILIYIGEIIGEVNIDLRIFDRAKSDVKIAMMLRGESDLKINYKARHIGAKSTSSFDLRGSLDDQAQKKSNLRIIFEKGCAESEASENEKITLLSTTAKNIASPTILCHEENVHGTHSASTGHIDTNISEYLQSRGLDINTTKKLLVSADIKTILNDIKDKDVLKSIKEALEYA